MTAAMKADDFERATFAKVAWRIVPLLFIGYVAAFLDRVNIGFAKLQMAGDLAFSDAIYGFGAGIFFIGYFVFEVPSNLILSKVGARVWLARIMVSWGTISAAFVFVDDVRWGGIAAAFGCSDAEFTFYLLRFLLGAAEAGFYPGVILYLTFWFPAGRRAQVVALFMTGIAVSNVIGSPISGAILQFMDGAQGMRGWEWLFLLEAIPSILIGLLFLALLPDGPGSAKWLSQAEQDLVIERVRRDEADKSVQGGLHGVAEVFGDPRVWAFAVVYFCGVTCFYAVNFWLPTIVQELGIAPTDYLRVGIISMIPWTFAVVAQIAWARHSDRSGERRWHAAVGLLLTIAGLMLLAGVGRAPIPSIAGLTLVTVGTGCWVVTFWSLPTSFLSGAAAAAGIAWINSFGNLGGHFGPDLIGRIRTASGGDSQAAFLALAAMALLGAIITVLAPTSRKSVTQDA
ncbi:MAG: MFS transporter [Novosphingobium sp.]|nr:MFS transporter [Novosphingobium sp.]